MPLAYIIQYHLSLQTAASSRRRAAPRPVNLPMSVPYGSDARVGQMEMLPDGNFVARPPKEPLTSVFVPARREPEKTITMQKLLKSLKPLTSDVTSPRKFRHALGRILEKISRM